VNRKGFWLEEGFIEQGRLIFGEGRERTRELKAGYFGTRGSNYGRERERERDGSWV